MMNSSSIKDHKKNSNREVYYSYVLVEAQSMSRGVTQGGQGREKEQQNLGYMPLFG